MGAKLIRDKVKDSDWTDEGAKKYIRRVKDDDEFARLLLAKLFEEIGELMAADTSEEALEEMADLHTTMAALMARDHDDKELMAAVERKFEKLGAFDEGWVWDYQHYLAQ